MPSRPLFASLVVLLALGCASSPDKGAPAQGEATPSAPAPVLQPVAGTEGFVVQLPPGTPKVQQGTVAIPTGEVKTTSWGLQTPEGVIYSVSTADYPEQAVAQRTPETFLSEAATGVVNALKGTLKEQRDVALDGHPGKAFTVASDQGELRGRTFLVGPRLYTLIVLYNPSVGAPRADAFLDSLALTAPVAPIPHAPPADGAPATATPPATGADGSPAAPAPAPTP